MNMKSKNLKNRLGKLLALFLMVIMVISHVPDIFGNFNLPGTQSDWTGWPLVEGVHVEAVQGGVGQQRFVTSHYLLTIGPGGPNRDQRADHNALLSTWGLPNFAPEQVPGPQSAETVFVQNRFTAPIPRRPDVSENMQTGTYWQVTALVPRYLCS